ncbi:MAG: trigger factor [Dongiaceae bacterium]
MNMQVTETNNQGLRRDYKVVVPASQLQTEIASELAEMGKSAKIPGFRPGKIPMPVLKQRFLGNILPRVVERAVTDSSSKVMNERGLRAAGQPKIEIVSFPEEGDLEYTMSVDLFPEIQPVDFKSLELERIAVDVPDEDIEEELKRMATRQRNSEPVATPRPSQNEDVVVIDFAGKLDGEPFDGGSATDHHLALGSGSFIPGFEEQLVGKSVGDQVVVDVKFPDEYPAEHLKGKAVQFDVTIKEIRELKPVEVNEEFAKSFGQESLDAMRKTVRDHMGREYQALTRSRMKRQLLDQLAEKHSFELPAGLVDAEFEAIWRQIEADQKAGRLDAEDKDKTEDQLRKEYRDIAERRVKLGLLLSEVGRVNNIEVSQEDLTRAVMAEARQYPGQEKQVVEYYQKQPQALAQLHAPIYEDKVVDYIIELAAVKERKLSPKGLVAEFGAESKEEGNESAGA